MWPQYFLERHLVVKYKGINHMNYSSICQFITPAFLVEVTQNMNFWSDAGDTDGVGLNSI
jgi:hypothetical protein